MADKKIKKGTKVSWASSGRGSKHKKKGTVLRYLDGGQNMRNFIPKKTPVSKIMTRNYTSSHRRYLVSVNEPKLGLVYYTPRAATIDEQNLPKDKKATRKRAA